MMEFLKEYYYEKKHRLVHWYNGRLKALKSTKMGKKLQFQIFCLNSGSLKLLNGLSYDYKSSYDESTPRVLQSNPLRDFFKLLNFS